MPLRSLLRALAGISPLVASSGRITRHPLNRFGDRQLNRALHTVANWRMLNGHEPTRHYLTRRRAEQKSDAEIRRCLKRYTARHLFRLMGAVRHLTSHRSDPLPHDSAPASRAIAGKSSGGLGAMITPMLRPDLFGAFATHAGDSLYEYCYLNEFAKAVRALRDYDHDIQKWWADFRGRTVATESTHRED